MEGMDGMMWLGWVLAGVLAVVVGVLLMRKPSAERGSVGAPRGEDGITRQEPARVDSAGDGARGGPSAGAALRSGTDALHGTLGYLRRAVIPELEELRTHVASSPGGGGDLLEQALDALEDLVFYAEPPPEESLDVVNPAPVVQEAVRQYTIETRVPVRVHPPADAIHVQLRPERLKDAVFMILANAGQYSGGRPIDVFLEDGSAGGFRIRIVDEGPGFSDEALERAFEPFWSTDPRGVGLGLPQARARVLEMKGRISLRNQPDGGGEVVLDFPRPDEGPAA
ncbi:MAG: sensor histidine kinase [Gemmatimonadales bacterium]|nr:MAG: sensor histidine kinase [Gemmatimonadales bacterium]